VRDELGACQQITLADNTRRFERWRQIRKTVAEDESQIATDEGTPEVSRP
jgi:hypothetical protein